MWLIHVFPKCYGTEWTQTSLNNSKSPQVVRAIFSILADLNNDVLCMILQFPSPSALLPSL